MTDEATPQTGRSPWGGWRQKAALVLIVAVAVVLVVLNAGHRSSPQQPPVAPTSTTSNGAAAPALAYLALGDSLSRGVQPDAAVTLKHGYPRDLVTALGGDLTPKATLIEAGCGGATTTSFIFGGKACQPDAPIPYANQDAATSQLSWAEAALKARGAKPTLVTLTIGGNDLTGCVDPSAEKVHDCLNELIPKLKANWATIARRLKAAAGPRTVLSVATTYDPVLGYIRLEGGKHADAAREFHKLIVRRINPAMRRIFTLKGWEIADLAFAMHEKGSIENAHATAVNAVCTLTWACVRGDVHLNDEGYQVAASVFEGAVLDALTKAVQRPLASGSS
ncbi:MAG: SGNH/GDSL hydrolase family protein [Solirubrobacteraceae bacterium]|nr:SGNH/GDSL hydrolase family protein [Patulibacter sp.]